MRRYFRAYPAISSRQQGADRLVYNETDLRTVLWQAVDPAFEGERPSTIRLAADIYLTKPIELGAYQYNVSIEGGDKYSIAHADGYTGLGYLFGVASGTTSNITFDGITFKVSGQLQSIFGGDNGGIVSEFALYDCFTENVNFAYTTKVFDSTINARGCDINAAAALGFFSLGAATFGGTITYATPALGGSATFEQKSTYGDIFSRGVPGVVCGNGATNISLTVDGGLLLSEFDDEELDGSDPTISVGNRTYINVKCSSTSSGSLFLSGAKGLGHVVTLIFGFVDASSSLTISDNTSVEVNKNHPGHRPDGGHSITFIYSKFANPASPGTFTSPNYILRWVEIARSENQ